MTIRARKFTDGIGESRNKNETPQLNFKKISVIKKKIKNIEVLRQIAPRKDVSVMESSTISNAQELDFWLFSVNRAQLWSESFTWASNPELPGSR